MIDIETRPARVWTWALFNQNISVDQIDRPTSLLCFAAKWYGAPEMMFHKSVRDEGRDFDRMVRAAHKLLCDADAVCHYNGVSFDVPRLNQEFLRLGLTPPPAHTPIDLKKVVMSKFSFVSSKLAFIGPELKIGAKVAHEGWELWLKCMQGEPNAWAKMERYNRQDVALLERLYTKVLPWIDGHPNMNLFEADERDVCPNCASDKLQRRGYHRTVTQVYVRYQCSDCGHWCRDKGRDRASATTSRR